MHLSPKELDRLTLFMAAELARKRRARGLRLNYPEARAVIADEILEGARDGRSVAELMETGAQILGQKDVLPGVAKLLGTLQVEGMFPDGQKLVTIHDPIRGSGQDELDDEPGQIVTGAGDIELSPGREAIRLTATNNGDRPIQVGSHYHFFEVNRAMQFDRGAAFGRHLDIPAGTAVRFEPGEQREVGLVEFGGDRTVFGLNGMTNGATDGTMLAPALERAQAHGFLGAE